MSDLLLGGRWLLAVVLIVAGLSKLTAGSRARVAGAIGDYGVIPAGLVKLAAVALPWLELIGGALLCLGVAAVVVASFVAVMLAAFAVTMGWHVARGRSFDCGCGADATSISWALAGRDLALCGIALAVALGPSGALSIWPAWDSGSSTVSAVSVMPVPLLTILVLVGVRLLMSAGRSGLRRPAVDQEGLA